MTKETAKAMVKPLHGARELRQADAHVTPAKLERAFRDLGITSVPGTPRQKFNVCLDAVSEALIQIARLITP
jgi:hypothetical protein